MACEAARGSHFVFSRLLRVLETWRDLRDGVRAIVDGAAAVGLLEPYVAMLAISA